LDKGDRSWEVGRLGLWLLPVVWPLATVEAWLPMLSASNLPLVPSMQRIDRKQTKGAAKADTPLPDQQFHQSSFLSL
jgi:hypothetical protein